MSEEQTEQPSEWVRINSKDGFSFLIKRSAAIGSGTLANMLSSEGRFAESQSNSCDLQEQPIIVQKVMEYLCYKAQYSKATSRDEIPDFQERVPVSMALELLMAADFLEA